MKVWPATLLLLGLPGAAFLYQGQELGLEEVELPDELRQDPVFFRTNGAWKGRDGCRVPIPWSGGPPGFGFTAGSPWLPIPADWTALSAEAQEGSPQSSLALHRAALELRRRIDALRTGSFAWRESPSGTLLFERASGNETIVCVVNLNAEHLQLPDGELLLASEPAPGNLLPPSSAAWTRV